jgi:hypothetical protein
MVEIDADGFSENKARIVNEVSGKCKGPAKSPKVAKTSGDIVGSTISVPIREALTHSTRNFVVVLPGVSDPI